MHRFCKKKPGSLAEKYGSGWDALKRSPHNAVTLVFRLGLGRGAGA
jgi:hypothetical protein